jgi:hypothetical protein
MANTRTDETMAKRRTEFNGQKRNRV